MKTTKDLKRKLRIISVSMIVAFIVFFICWLLAVSRAAAPSISKQMELILNKVFIAYLIISVVLFFASFFVKRKNGN